MTPEELRSLADEAQNYFSWEELWADASLARSDAQLFFIAPDLARLCAEFAEVTQLYWLGDDDALLQTRAALAKLSELKP